MPIRPENRDRLCDWCGQLFEPYLGRRDVRWCSTRCKKRAASARPRTVPKACAHCGTAFRPERSAKQRFCAPSCKTAARAASLHADAERPERHRATQKAYSRTEAYRVAQRSAKARRRSAEREGAVTVADWAAILDRYGHRCAYCPSSGPLTMDHARRSRSVAATSRQRSARLRALQFLEGDR